MSLNRIKFRDRNGSNEYEVPINPDSWQNDDSVDYDLIETIDGAPIQMFASFDQRERSFVWPNYPNSNSTYTAMVSELKGYKGKQKQLDTQDIDYLSHGWKNIRVTDVSTVPSRGGQLRYSLVLKYVFEEDIT